ncbi:UNVERIFIED_CONTAM: Auxilin-related protein 1 [Sesamum latifolium]|uniref:Auxilin-related protein 1 n=1 Tax=Sesamum latifolium TaxID=2727402 RepID=A0AAW2TSK5_9LAMI
MRMGMPTPMSPPRRSTDDSTSYLPHDPFNPQHFTDVFGGPPRTILSRQFSTNYPRSSSSMPFFHQDIFQQQEKASPPPVCRSGRSLPQFSIPSWKQWSGERNQRNRQSDGFYNDVFGWDDESVVKSRSRSKTSSSALSSEELSPLRPAVSDDGYDSISLFASKLSFRVSADDLQLNSPSSAVSSVCQSDKEIKTRVKHEILRKGTLEQDLEDESVSSYVIEINSDNKEWTCESNDVDEAIAWAKEKFQTHFSEEKPIEEILKGHQLSERTESFQSTAEQQYQWTAEEETSKILWPNSGWLTIPLMNIIDSSQVKLAYQKAQLCLHPDKLQERGATLPEKYIAEKVSSALQDAWAAFISQDVFCH